MPPFPDGTKNGLSRSEQIAVDHQLGIFRGRLVPVPVIDIDPGIVDKDIEAADFVVDRGADPLDRVRVRAAEPALFVILVSRKRASGPPLRYR